MDYDQKLKHVRFDNVCSILRRAVWEKCPFGNRQFGEDVAWSLAVQKMGFTIGYDPFARVLHSHDRPKEYTKQRALIGNASLLELFDVPAPLSSTLTVTDLQQTLSQLQSDCDWFLEQLTKAGPHESLSRDHIRKSINRLFRRILETRADKIAGLERFRLELIPLLAILLHVRPKEEIDMDEVAILTHKVQASIEGRLLGEYRHSMQCTNIPLEPLFEELISGSTIPV